MKGVVFVEFIEMVDSVFSSELAETIIIACDLPSQGVYTATGTYDHNELLAMVVELSKRTEVPVADLVKAFGRHLFQVFSGSFPVKINPKHELFEFLESVENYIHVEVRKLYPDASLPSIACEKTGENTMELSYKSACPFADLANGLILESAEHFKTNVTVERSKGADDGTAATFIINKLS
jgi:hypothetical protein